MKNKDKKIKGLVVVMANGATCPALSHCGSSFKWGRAGQPALVILVKYVNPPRPAAS